MNRRVRPPYWQAREPDTKLSKALAATIESVEEAREIRRLRAETLNEPPLCSNTSPCASPFCPVCARQYRLWFSAQLYKRAHQLSDMTFATILMSPISSRELFSFDLTRLKERLRKRLARADLPAAGGIEFAFDPEANTWTPHLHLIVWRPRQELKWKLRRLFPDGGSRGVKCQPLRDIMKQVTYLQKFNSYYRTPNGKPKRLTEKPLRALHDFMAQHEFTDFLFLVGFRRRGSRITTEPWAAHIVGDSGDAGDAIS